MTDKSKSKQSTKPAPSPYERKTYDDAAGIPRTVLVPPGEKDMKSGIPLSLDLAPLYQHMPQEFMRALYKALHAQGLIEPKDYFSAGASERYQRAMRDVIKHDFLNVLALANEELKHKQ